MKTVDMHHPFLLPEETISAPGPTHLGRLVPSVRLKKVGLNARTTCVVSPNYSYSLYINYEAFLRKHFSKCTLPKIVPNGFMVSVES